MPLHFPNLPYLYDGNFKMTQSIAIMHYLSNKYDPSLEGYPSLLDKTYTLMVIDELVDTKRLLTQPCYNSHDQFEKLIAENMQKADYKLTGIQKFLGDKKWIMGSQLTIPDFLLLELLEQYGAMKKELFKQKIDQRFQDYINLMLDIKQIKSYRESDRFIERPFNNIQATWK